jgi:hypothetical protein
MISEQLSDIARDLRDRDADKALVVELRKVMVRCMEQIGKGSKLYKECEALLEDKNEE